MLLKKKNAKRLFLAVVLGLVCFAIINTILMVSWFDASGTVLSKGWFAESDSESKTVDIPHIDIADTDRTIVFTKDVDFDAQQDLGLVVPFVSGTAFKAYLNGTPVGGEGRIGDATANIWYTSFVYPLENVRQGRNTVSIVVYGLYDVGFHVPPYIEEYDKAVAKVYTAGKLRNNLILILAGVSTGFGLLLLISFFKNKRKDRPSLYAAIIGLLAYFAVVDCVFDVGAGTIGMLLLLKKTRFAIMFASLAFVALIFNESRQTPKKWVTAAVCTATVLSYIPIAVSASFYDWYTWMWISFLIQGVNIIGMFYLTLTDKRYKTMHIMMCVLILATFAQGLLSNLFGLNIPNSLQFSFVAVSLMIGATATSQLNNIFDKNQYLEAVSMRDSLTGAFNRRMIDQVIGGREDCVVLMDIDNFKGVNDNYGHQTGDRVLCDLVAHIGRITRKADILIRMGGDEFCLLLKDCPLEMAKSKMDALCESFSGTYSAYGIGISYGRVMLEGSFDQSLTRADALMYEMKSMHKG